MDISAKNSDFVKRNLEITLEAYRNRSSREQTTMSMFP